MEYLELFWTFFKVGLFSFGGGYGTIPVIQSEVVDKGLISEELFTTFIGIAESTPGPFAVNIATFIGSSRLGLLGSLLATLGVVLPAFLIILLIVTLLKSFAKNKWVNAFLSGAQPFIIGLIVSTGILVIIKCIWVNFANFSETPNIAISSLIVIASLFAVCFLYKLIFKKNINPIVLIVLSAIIGIIFLK